VLDAIRQFEDRTSGEIRVHLANDVSKDILVEAQEAFETLVWREHGSGTECSSSWR